MQQMQHKPLDQLKTHQHKSLVRVLYRELLQSILVVQITHHQTRAQRQILHNEDLLQSILLLEVAGWIQTFDCKNLGPLLLFASKDTMAEHRM